MTTRYTMMQLLTLFLLVVVSCTPAPKYSDLASIYDGVASSDDGERNPVIVIPGVLGSKLRDEASGVDVWGFFAAEAAHPNDPKTVGLIGVPMRESVPLAQLRDGVRPTGVLDRLRVKFYLGLKVAPRAYAQILTLLGAGGYVDQSLGESGAINYGNDHYTCFQFAYDWRKSSAENAAKLHEFIEAKRIYVSQQRKKRFGTSKPVKFDIVAHSMGGLLTRYYLRYGNQPLPSQGVPKLTWAGAKNVEKVVLIGTPNLGSTETLKQLTQGIKLAPLTPLYDPVLIGTMPSAYELLPRQRHGTLRTEDKGESLDLLNPELWARYEWGLMNPKYAKTLQRLLPDVEDAAARRRIAADHLRKCLNNARQFHRALDRPAKAPAGLSMVTWVGESGGTLTELKAESREPTPLKYGPGDGTVSRYSVIADERGPFPQEGKYRGIVPWDDINYIYRDHVSLTKDPSFFDNLLAFLLDQGGSAGRKK